MRILLIGIIGTIVFFTGCAHKKFTNIHDAVRNNHIDSVQALIKQKVNLNVLDDDGNSPLHYSIINQNEDMVATLVENGKVNLNLQNKKGETALFIVTSLGNEDLVEYLLENKANPNLQTKNGKTPLLVALENKKRDLAEELYENKARSNVKDSENNTPLIFAIENRYFDLAEDFIEESLNINVVRSKDKMTALGFAVKYQEEDLVEELLEKKANPNLKDYTGGTPLMVASAYGNKDIVEILLEAKADFKAVREKDKMTAVKFANQYGHVEIEDLLLVKLGKKEEKSSLSALLSLTEETEVRGSKNGKLLFYSEIGDLSKVEDLVESGADINVAYTNTKTTPLIESVKNGHEDISEFLLGKNADKDLKDIKGLTAYDYAVKINNEDLIELLKVEN
ncbi:MAG: ankyrin repeat domain-containing protein [Campylobacterales bacterium]|nr:ankyrin repeat domain-containing protein [Campylobacterales bacterium]